MAQKTDIRTLDLDGWTVDQLRDFADKCNRMTDAKVAEHGTPLAWLEADGEQAEVIFAAWRNPDTKRGVEFGWIKGYETSGAMLALPAEQQRGLNAIYIRLPDRQTAIDVSRIIGDARPDPKPGKPSHLLSVGMRWAGKAT